MSTSNLAPMQVATSRFGLLEAVDDQVIRIQGGLLGFPDADRYLRVPVADADGWLWLQSTDDPDLAFLAISAFRFFPDYDVEVPDADIDALGIEGPDDAEVLALVTVRRDADDAPPAITANLLGPVVVNRRRNIARQVVLSDSDYSTRETLAG